MVILMPGLGGTTTDLVPPHVHPNLMKPWPPVPVVHPIDDTLTGEPRRRGCGLCNGRLDVDEAAE
jgi:hypothetical protein